VLYTQFLYLISKQLDTNALKNFSNDFVTVNVEKLKVQVLQQTAARISAHRTAVSLRHTGRSQLRLLPFSLFYFTLFSVLKTAKQQHCGALQHG